MICIRVSTLVHKVTESQFRPRGNLPPPPRPHWPVPPPPYVEPSQSTAWPQGACTTPGQGAALRPPVSPPRGGKVLGLPARLLGQAQLVGGDGGTTQGKRGQMSERGGSQREEPSWLPAYQPIYWSSPPSLGRSLLCSAM